MRYVITILALVFAVGCAGVKRESIRFATLPPKPIEQVELLPGPPSKSFKVVGHIFVDGKRSANWQSLAEAARVEAAEIGADAVFMGNAGEYQAGTMILPGSSTTTTMGSFSGRSFNANSNTFAGPSMAVGIQKKQFTGIAIVYQQP